MFGERDPVRPPATADRRRGRIGLGLATGLAWLGIITAVVLLWSVGTGLWSGQMPQSSLDTAVRPTAYGHAVIGLAALLLA
jgi:hypothetical protein